MIVTIWIALALFVAGEFEARTSRSLQPVARGLFLLGALICVVHIVLAMSNVHGWHHAAAIEATAEQVNAVYGVRWGGGLYVNYVFTAVWIADGSPIEATAAALEQRLRADLGYALGRPVATVRVYVRGLRERGDKVTK